ncbi:HemK2/MTQ2 family protein methyltransferase [Streptomyces sp. NPDC004435]|uniref:HemK2/MTQ2 family protein methyltransferase n=1 Tax=Streptomyces sp. NPDC004435 TaxID=3364701 RepID=UPI0036B33AFA
MSSTVLPPGALPGGLFALPRVYRPQEDTHLLAAALAREEVGPLTDVLEIGTGTGALALHAARRGAATVTAVDVSWPAVVTARMNALFHRLPLRVLHGDFAERTHGRRFDLIVTNPPYVPAPGARLPRGAERAWDAGADGRLVIDRICEAAGALLRPGGVLVMVHSGMCGAETTVNHLTGGGLSATVAARASVPWGPVLRSRRAWLERRGLAGADEQREELVVIRARNL